MRSMGLLVMAGIVLVGAFMLQVAVDLLRGEIRGRLDKLPYGLLHLARRRLPPELRASRCDDEWKPELDYILSKSGWTARYSSAPRHALRAGFASSR